MSDNREAFEKFHKRMIFADDATAAKYYRRNWNIWQAAIAHSASLLADKDEEISCLKSQIDFLNKEIEMLKISVNHMIKWHTPSVSCAASTLCS